MRSNNECMSVADGFDGDSENVTLFLVWQPTTATGVEMNILEKWVSGSSPYPYVLRSSIAYSFRAYDGSSNPAVISTTRRQVGVTHLLSARRVKNSIIQLRINQTQEGSVADNTTSSTFNSLDLFIGCRDSENYMDGYIGEIIIFSRALKDYEVESIEEYLSQKWGIK